VLRAGSGAEPPVPAEEGGTKASLETASGFPSAKRSRSPTRSRSERQEPARWTSAHAKILLHLAYELQVIIGDSAFAKRKKGEFRKSRKILQLSHLRFGGCVVFSGVMVGLLSLLTTSLAG